MPVLILKVSVGSSSDFSESVLNDYFGMNQMIKRTSRGRIIPAATMRLGVAVQSLKKQMMIPTAPKTHTAMVPFPIPPTRPS